MAFEAAMRIFELTKTFPREETYSLVDQIRRASRSVCTNIAEGWRKRRYEAADEAGNTVRMAAAVKLFEMGQLSSGAAARLAGVPRLVFLSRLADYGVDTFRLTEAQLTQETRLA